MTSPALPPAIAALGQQIARMQAQIAQLQRNQRTSQLGNTSIDNGALIINDPSGNAQMQVGLQADGTFTVASTSTVAPPVAPDTPLAGPGILSVLVIWDGAMADGSAPLSDFECVQVHCSPAPGFTPSTSTLQGTLPAAGVFTVGALTAGTAYYVALIAVNESGQVSPASAQATATAQSVLQNIAANSITAAWLAAGIVYAGIVDATTVTAAQYISTSAMGEFLAYSSSAPASGTLTNAIAGSAGTDGAGNPYPAGFYGQQVTLQDISPGPAAFAGASVLYSDENGRPWLLSSSGAASILSRSNVNVAQFTVGGTTASAIGAPLSYYAGEANQSSSFEIEIRGSGIWSTGTPVNIEFWLYLDGSAVGGATGFVADAAAYGAGTGFAYRFSWLFSFLAGGHPATLATSVDGTLTRTGLAFSPTVSMVAAGQATGTACDATVNHTFQCYAAMVAPAAGQSLTTFHTRMSRFD